MRKEQKIVILVGSVPMLLCEKIQATLIRKKRNWKVINLIQKKEFTNLNNPFTYEIDFNNTQELKEFFKNENITSITAHTEKNIPLLIKVLPYAPDRIFLPSKNALEKSTQKDEMRKAFYRYNKNITPRFFVLPSYEQEIVNKVKKKFDFPVMIKPSGLAASAFVQWVHSPEELEISLKKVFSKIQGYYLKKKGRGKPSVIIEEYIEGNIYSIDAHVDNDFNCYFYPLVKYRMAPQKGFDDFFVYDISTPVVLKEEVINKAHNVAIQGLHALDLKNCTAHIELIKDSNGDWKIIEIGPRIGGNRSNIYSRTFGLEIDLNDILLHTGELTTAFPKVKGHSSIMRFYSKEEGFIKKTSGIKKVTTLESFVKIDRKLKRGEKCLHSKNGGAYVFKVDLFNKDKGKLTADKRKIENMVHIETVKHRKNL